MIPVIGLLFRVFLQVLWYPPPSFQVQVPFSAGDHASWNIVSKMTKKPLLGNSCRLTDFCRNIFHLKNNSTKLDTNGNTFSRVVDVKIQTNSSFLCNALRIQMIMKQFIMNLKNKTEQKSLDHKDHFVCCLKKVLALKICIVLYFVFFLAFCVFRSNLL